MKTLIHHTARFTKNPVIIRLIFKSFPQLIWTLSDNDCTPGDLLRDWSKHKESIMRLRVAQNLSTPIDVVQSMKNDKNYEVAARARQACIDRAASEEYREWMRGKQ